MRHAIATLVIACRRPQAASTRPAPRRAHPADAWAKAGPEPSMDEALSDPIVHLVMRRDGIDAGITRATAKAARALLLARNQEHAP